MFCTGLDGSNNHDHLPCTVYSCVLTSFSRRGWILKRIFCHQKILVYPWRLWTTRDPVWVWKSPICQWTRRKIGNILKINSVNRKHPERSMVMFVKKQSSKRHFLFAHLHLQLLDVFWSPWTKVTDKQFHSFGFSLTKCINHIKMSATNAFMIVKHWWIENLMDVCDSVSKVTFLLGRMSWCTQWKTLVYKQKMRFG